MATIYYVAVAHDDGDPTTGLHVWFPDFGEDVFTFADDIDTAWLAACERVQIAIEELEEEKREEEKREEGKRVAPRSMSIAEARVRGRDAEGEHGPVVNVFMVPARIAAGAVKRLNITMDSHLLDDVDNTAALVGVNRSAFITAAVQNHILVERRRVFENRLYSDGYFEAAAANLAAEEAAAERSDRAPVSADDILDALAEAIDRHRAAAQDEPAEPMRPW